MKKTQCKDLLRNIRRQKVSFLSIIVIAAIGVTAFLGIDYTAAALRRNASVMYNRQNFRDLEILSTLLLSPQDLTDLRGVEGVEDAEPVRMTEARLSVGGAQDSVTVLSVPERVNRPLFETRLNGRLPEAPGECALEQDLAAARGLRPGDRIRLLGSDGGTAPYLTGTEYEITGVLRYPEHTNTNIQEKPQVYVPWEAFDEAALKGCFMKAELVMTKAPDIDRFSAAYDKAAAALTARIEAKAQDWALRRDLALRDEAEARIADGRRELDEGRAALEEARRTLDEKAAELEAGQRELAEAEQTLADAKAQLDEGWETLEAGRRQLEEGWTRLDAEKAKLDEAASQLAEARTLLQAGNRQLISAFDEIEAAKARVRDPIRQIWDRAAQRFPNAPEIHWASVRTAELYSYSETAMYLEITRELRLDLSWSPETAVQRFVNSERLPPWLLAALYESAFGTEAPVLEPEGGEAAEDAEPVYDLAAIRPALAARVMEFAEPYTRLSQACKDWDAAHLEFMQKQVAYEKGRAQYEDGLRQYEEAESLYAEKYREYQEGLSLWQEKQQEYADGLTAAEDGRAALEEGRAALEAGEAEYAEGLKKLADGEAELEAAQRQLDGLEPCRWLCFNARGNASFVQTDIGSGNLLKLKMTFSLLFVAVGGLVIFATVGKMVDEQRRLVGTTKALGFYQREIFVKYLSFGLSATLIGAVLGLLIARFAIEPFLLIGFNQYYVFDYSRPILHLAPTLLVFAAGAVLAAGAVWLACARLLREPAIRLMQARAPRAGKKGSGGRSALSLYSRLILLNIRSDLKRVVVTVVSVAGCCTLVVVGFTLRSGVSSAGALQYEGITRYDQLVSWDPAAPGEPDAALEGLLQEAGCAYTRICHSNVSYRVKDLQLAELFCGDIDAIRDFHRLDDWRTGQPLAPTDEGVLIQRRIAEHCGLEPGSSFELTLGGVRTARVRVAGVFENYIGRMIVMSAACYERCFGPMTPNAFLVRLEGADGEALQQALCAVEGCEGVRQADADKAVVEASPATVDTVILLFIGIAGIMAGVVLLNLTNIYILQKKPELVVMRINGFSVREVVGYVLRETVVTTVLGVVLGVGLGAAVAYSITRDLEQPFLRFKRSPDPLAWVIGALITVFFAVIVNWIALRKVKDLKLTDA